ncbi:methyltransferase domain-containing protein [Candidatus Vallotia lariciata]|uniref:methyltransferase domain-containing protein n=1 Tax=Candidatus Vallotia laricis TaxID=2018052 RepID=UPI001D002FC9|nr:methyltransferase domain-containing protein [Candidatus Vallotia lariciata]UDG83322.1 malonyl-CoA O-methyltransferase [Candidatus Vallotia lariciata]
MSINRDYTTNKDTNLYLESTLKLRQLRRVFDRHAAQFRNVAFLPREVARRMHKRLLYIKSQPACVLDAGCGAGEDIDVLRTLCVQATIYGVDLSRAMLSAGHSGYSIGCGNISGWHRFLLSVLRYFSTSHIQPGNRIQADFSALPFAPGRFDLLWSNLALQWHAHPDLVFLEWKRVLKTGGLLMFSTLGPDTLQELRSARAAADGSNSQNMRNFFDMHDIGNMLVTSGFEIPVIDMDTLTVMYSSPKSLLEDVRIWGAVPQRGVSNGDTLCKSISRGTYYRILDALETQRRPDGRIPLTFEILYGYARKAIDQMTPEGHNIIRVNEIDYKSYGASKRSF